MRKLTAFILAIMICVTLVTPGAFAATESESTPSLSQTLAVNLKTLGLFKGVSDTNFDLNREPTRIEAVVMLIRLLGKDAEAKNGTWTHSFTDVPQWANNYIGYAFSKGLVKGSSDTKFGTGTATAQALLTLVLRALGYSDAQGADFTYSDPFTLAKSIGVLPDFVDTKDFLRADSVIIMYASLCATIKGTSGTLADKLISDGVFTKTQFDAAYDKSTISNAAKAISSGSMTTGNQYASIKRTLKAIGTYDSTLNGYKWRADKTEYAYAYLVYRPIENDIIGVSYSIDGPVVGITTIYYSADSSVNVTMRLKLVDGSVVNGSGLVEKSSFNSKTALTLISYDGTEDYKTYFTDGLNYAIGETLTATEYILVNHVVPLNIADLGFIAYFSELIIAGAA